MSRRADYDEIVEQAAAFHARVAASDMTPDEWRELEKWMGQDAEHRAVFESMGSMSDSLASLAHRGKDQTMQAVAPELTKVLADSEQIASGQDAELRNSTSRRLAIAAGLLVALVVPALYFVGQPDGPPPVTTAYQTEIGERMNLELNDGSVLAINADSRISVTFSDLERRLILQRGEIDIEIASDTARPFHVTVGDHVATAVGTAFAVHYRDEPARITVREGRVLVVPVVSPQVVAPIALRGGQQLVLEPGATPVDLGAEELARSAAWRDGWLHFNGERLDHVFRVLDPYFEKPFVITDTRAAELRVGGSFNVDQTGPLLTALESLLPIAITHGGDNILVDYAQDDGQN
jgi:transmembrane sensor